MKPPRRVEVLQREPLYEGFFRAERVTLQHEKFQGGLSAPIHREVMIKSAAAGVLPYDPVSDEVLLIEQFRIGALEAGQDGWLLEIIAGYIESGESGEAMVRREAQEEAGQVLGRVEHVMDFLLSPASSSEMFSLYLAEADLRSAGGIHGLASEGEDIRVDVMSLDQAWQAARNGRICNAPALLALQSLMLQKDRLRQRWRA